MSGAFTTGPQCGLRCAPPTYDLDVSGGPQGEAPKGEITFTKGTLFVDAQFAQGTGDDTLLGGPGNDLLLGGLGRDNCPPEGADVRIGCEQ